MQADEADAAGDTEKAREIEGRIRELDEEHRQLVEEMDAETAEERQTDLDRRHDDFVTAFGELEDERDEAIRNGDAEEARRIQDEMNALAEEYAEEAGMPVDDAVEIGESGELTGTEGLRYKSGKRRVQNLEGSDQNSIKNQIRAHTDELSRMEIAESVPISLVYGKKKDQILSDMIQRFGENHVVDKQGYGRIVFGKRQMNKGLEHTHADIIYEAAVLYAVPSVLKRGTVVGRENNHGGNGQRTVTFAAPIELTVGENRYRVNMGVVVIEERKNYYHSHQVLMPDGSVLQLGETRKTSPIPAVASPKNGDVVAPISDVSTSIINGEDSGVKLSSNAIGREDGEGDLLEAAVPVYDVTPNAQKQAGTQGSLLDAVTESTESAPAAENGERRAVAGYYGEEYANERKAVEKRAKAKAARERKKQRQAEAARYEAQQRKLREGTFAPQAFSEDMEARTQRHRLTESATGKAQELGDMLSALTDQFKESETKTVDPKDVMRETRKLLGDDEEYTTTLSEDYVARKLTELVEEYRNADDKDAALGDMYERIHQLAQEICDSRVIDMDEEYGDEDSYGLMDLLKETPIKVGPRGRKQIKDAFGSLKEFRKAVGGSSVLQIQWVDSDSQSTYEDLGGMIGGYLDEGVRQEIAVHSFAKNICKRGIQNRLDGVSFPC